MTVGESDTEHLAESIKGVFDTLLEKFHVLEQDEKAKLSDLAKLTSAIGYMAQVHAGLRKNLYVEKEIKEIRELVDKIPAEVIAKIHSPQVLEDTVALR